MLPFTKSGDPVVAAVGHPADNATSTTLTQTAATAVEANAYESFVVDLFLKDPETGAKSVVVTLWGKNTADGTVGDGTWNAIPTPASLEGAALSRTLSASAAYEGITRNKVAMRECAYKYIAAKAVVTHCDPTSTPATYMALIVHGEVARRDV